MTTVPWDVLVAKAKESGITEIAPVGSYQARIEATDSGVNKNDNAFIELRLKITEGEHAGKRPTTFYHKIYQTEKSAGIFMENLKAFGITGEVAMQQRPTLDQIARSIVGKSVTVNTQVASRNGAVQTDRNGDPQIEVKWALKSPVSGAVAVTAFPAVGGSGPAAAVGSVEDPGF